MRKTYLLTFLLFSLHAPFTKAQTAFNTIDSVNINNINASVLVHGDMWWNPAELSEHCFYPANAQTNVSFIGSIWMSGYDAGNNLHVAAQTYRQNGNDYWPGPLDASDTLTYATSQKWAKIWKVNRTDIQAFLSVTTHTSTNTPAAILTWPAKGNTNAQGTAGAALTITDNMAPFVDLNGNGIYEPLLGEYPDIPGDQALWWVFSDRGPVHTETHGRALGVEMHAMAYAYHRGTAIDNVIYYDYHIVNKSANNYHSYRIAQLQVAEIGYYNDDFIGFDSTWRMGIAYNSTNDDGYPAGHPPGSFGTDPPQAAVTMIVQPGDAGSSYAPVGSFMYYNNDFSFIGNPFIDTEYNHYMRAATRTGLPIDSVDTTTGACAVTNPNYVFPGDPGDATTWSECNCASYPGNRRFILSSSDFTLNAGSTAHAVFALIVADSANGCPTNFNKIRTLADTAWNIYHHPYYWPSSVPGTSVINQPIHVYPNPARDKLYVETAQQNAGIRFTIYNTLGQVIDITANKNGQKYELDISTLPAGVYNIHYQDEKTLGNAKFVRE